MGAEVTMIRIGRYLADWAVYVACVFIAFGMTVVTGYRYFAPWYGGIERYSRS